MTKIAFLYIHGVQPNLETADISGYSKKFHKALLRKLSKPNEKPMSVRRFEIVWAPVTFGFKTQHAKLQFDTPPKRGGKWPIRGRLRNFIYPAVIDILYYVKNKGSESSRAKMPIMEKLHRAVCKIEKQGYERLVLFAHSLGSVAAYDYVFRFEKRFPFPKRLTLEALVTFGSPISLFASGMGYPVSTKIKKPAHVKRWINLWDHDDLIAGRLLPHFPRRFSKDFLTDIPVNTAWVDPVKAHEGYWKSKEVRHKIAAALAKK